MSKLPYRRGLDGLRAIAVLAIMIFHLNSRWLAGGFVGVDMFFVISGFLITAIIVTEADNQTFSILQFYQRRIARILPAFLAMALVTLLAASLIYSAQDLALAGGYMAAAALSLVNFKLMLQGSYFELLPDAHPFMHCWSLSVEEQFYLIFPLLVLTLRHKLRRFLVPALILLSVGSLAACLALTWVRPVWAFYLPATRAWELLSGGILAIVGCRSQMTPQRYLPPSRIAASGLLLVGASLLITRESGFPGYQALLPVLGTLCLIYSTDGEDSGPVGTILASRPLVFIGKISYSLYLWHWPVFSLTDYQMLMASESTRVLVKVAATGLLATASYYYIERPARARLGEIHSRKLAYAFAVTCILVSVPVGLTVQKRHYINAKNAREGRLVFNGNGKAGCIILMGDSQASVYGTTLREFAEARDFRLIVISVAASDALPPEDDAKASLWQDSLDVIEREKPMVIVLASAWSAYLDSQGQRLRQVVDVLKPKTDHLILITQPPVLPASATRSAIRRGARPPFCEDTEEHRNRIAANEQVRHTGGANVQVIDLEPLLGNGSKEIPFFDNYGRPLYHDRSHLSGYGALRIRDSLNLLLILQ